ncbi:MAG: trypsin-like peptidase domain-containing protein [Roseimicrobium sp.]
MERLLSTSLIFLLTPLCTIRGEEPPKKGLDTLLMRDGKKIENSDSIPLSYARVVRATQPSVVTILTLTNPEPVYSAHREEPQPRNPFNLTDPEPEKKIEPQRGGGSGVVLTAEGHVITNNHVVEDAHIIKVRLPNSTKDLDATLVGRDPSTDLALLKVNTSPLKPITVGDSSQTEPGDVVLALGSPFGFEQTVTLGIVSGTGRTLQGMQERETLEDFIQTDAPINPGNSGGALVDAKGRLIGINTATYGGGWMFANSIGFAVPSNLVVRVANDLLVHGRVIRGFLGVVLVPVEEKEALAITGRSDRRPGKVTDITADSPAEKAGFTSGDIITAVNGVSMPTSSKLSFVIAGMVPGTKAEFTVLRGTETLTLSATLSQTPKAYDRPSIYTPQQEAQSFTLQPGLEVGVLSRAHRFRIQVPIDLAGVRVTLAESDGKPMTSLLKDDVILEMNGRPVKSPTLAKQVFDEAPSGKPIMFRLWRNGGEAFASIKKQ